MLHGRGWFNLALWLLEKPLRQLLQALVTLLAGADEDLFDVRQELALSPIVSGRAFRASGVARARAIEQRFSGRFVKAGIFARRQHIAPRGIAPASRVFLYECA